MTRTILEQTGRYAKVLILAQALVRNTGTEKKWWGTEDRLRGDAPRGSVNVRG